jgi:FMN reductase
VYAASEDWGGGGDAHTDGLAVRVDRAAGELADLLLLRPPATRSVETVIPFAEQLAALRP